MSDIDTYIDLNLAHVSLYHGLTQAQSEHDAKRIYRKGYHWVTGTEAGQDPLQTVLREMAADFDYKFSVYKSNWIAVRKDIITPGSYNVGAKTVVENDDYVGRGHDLNILFNLFHMDGVGDVAVAASHYALRGRPGTGELSINREDNEKVAKHIGLLADQYGEGTALFFYGGDQNIPDDKYDTFFSQPLTSIQDELKKWPGTGHGPIDVIASADADARVEPVYVRALDDTEQFMHTDHFVLEAGYRVRALRG